MFNAFNFILPIDPVVVPAGVVCLVYCSSTVSFIAHLFYKQRVVA